MNSDDRLILRRNALSQGITDADITRALRGGTLERVGWGGYVPVPGDRELDEFAARERRYRDSVLAAVRIGGERRYPSHQSAATLLGIPLLDKDTSTVHFTSPTSGRITERLVVHQSRIIPDDLIDVDGILVTSIARTVCDVAREGSFRQALCALDSGLFQGRKRGVPVDVAACAAAMRRQHGIAVLRSALPLADDRSESIGESLSRGVMVESRSVPRPELQVEVVVADGSMKRCDFGWRDAEGRVRVVGEFDGRFKYHRLSAASGHRLAEDVIYAEKLREDAIRDCGIVVVRWTWQELRDPQAFVRKLLTALRRAGLVS
ncbi:hypothetical protein [Gordonia polyisoprenivorans]|uniref:type IV toxin-antitoxin system AbiEi family antitoxin domain-containing protein n=1 Tax=Gordonia polyisoprenivorans TaxID=84595 RepID=UPI0030CF19EE